MQQKPKPIRRANYGIISRPNIPFSAPLTPGLNRPINTNAIGFLTDAYHEAKPHIFDWMAEGKSSTEIIDLIKGD